MYNPMTEFRSIAMLQSSSSIIKMKAAIDFVEESSTWEFLARF